MEENITVLVDAKLEYTKQLTNIDYLMVKNYHVSIAQLMECAGLATAELARSFFNDFHIKKTPASVSIFVGKGNNGGDGLVAASHLYNWGVDVRVYLCHSIQHHKPLCINHIQRLKLSGVHIKELKGPKYSLSDKFISDSDLIIDGLLGFGLKGEVKEPFKQIITQLNTFNSPILSIDTPSGLNTSTGYMKTCIQADTTVSLGCPKKGFLQKNTHEKIGRLLIADIGITHTLYKRLRIKHYPKFYSGKFIEIFL